VLVGPTVDPRARSGIVQALRWVRSAVHERPSFAPVLAADLVEIGPVRGWQTARHMLRDHIEDKLPRVTAPTLIVRGTRDEIVPQRWAEEMVRLLPRGELALVPGSAHAVNHRDPVALSRLTKAFLGTAPRVPPGLTDSGSDPPTSSAYEEGADPPRIGPSATASRTSDQVAKQ
jgi:pimeloyl-ACP methyl ester carboxylesterase